MSPRKSDHDEESPDCITHDQTRTSSNLVSPKGTTITALGVHKAVLDTQKVDSLLCEILIAGFWVATAVLGLLSLVSCMRSLMMACLSTEPAGTPGRLSGKS